MSDASSFYMALPQTQREKLREKQKQRTYREFVDNLTALDANAQMDAESYYLIQENRLLYERLTAEDTRLLDITPDNYRILGKLAKSLPDQFREDVTVMKYNDLMRGYDYYRQHPPMQKSNQIPLEVEQLIVDMAVRHLTWGAPHILHAMRNIGYLNLKEYHVRVALTRNHIPVARVRMRKGISWRDFAEVLKRSVDAGVIVR